MNDTANNLKNTVMFHAGDGENLQRTPQTSSTSMKITLAGGYGLSVHLEDLEAGIKRQATLHGLKQKLVDSVAGKSGKEASQALQATYDMLLGGNWTRPREAGVGGGVTLLIEAMIRLFNKTHEECQTVIDGLSEADAKALPKHKQIAAMILTIKAERAALKAAQATVGDDDGEAFNPFV